MKKFFTAFVSVVSAISLTACGRDPGDAPEGNDGSSVVTQHRDDISGDDVLLVSERSNWAWGYHNTVKFCEADGDVYCYTSSMDRYPYGDREKAISVTDSIDIVREYGEPLARIDSEKLLEIYDIASGVSPDAEFTVTNARCDYGQDTIYCVSKDTGQLVKLESIGDNDEICTDKKAHKAAEKYSKLLSNNPTSEVGPVDLYSCADIIIESFECDYSGEDVFIVAHGYEELKKVADIYGISFGKIINSDFCQDCIGTDDANLPFVITISEKTSPAKAVFSQGDKLDMIRTGENEGAYCTAAVMPDNVLFVNDDKYISFSGAEWIYAADLPEPEKPSEPEPDSNEIIYTGDDIFIENLNCEPFSRPDKDRFTDLRLLVTNEAQLEYAYDRYQFFYEEPFEEMRHKYPIDKYSYLVEINVVASGGYYLEASGVSVKDNIVSFVLSDKSYTPDPDSMQTDEMGGFTFIAAIPHELLPDECPGWTVPDINDLTQYINYEMNYMKNIDKNCELCDIYGTDDGYIITSADAAKDLISDSDDVLNSQGEPVLSFLEKYDYDVDNVLVRFCRCNNDNRGSKGNDGVYIDNGEIEIVCYASESDDSGGEENTCIVYAVVGKKYLTSPTYDNWIIL